MVGLSGASTVAHIYVNVKSHEAYGFETPPVPGLEPGTGSVRAIAGKFKGPGYFPAEIPGTGAGELLK